MGIYLTNMRDLVGVFANAINLINPEVENHHEQVTYFASHIAKSLDLDEGARREVFYGALQHDVGAVLVEGQAPLAELEARPGDLAVASASVLRMFPACAGLAGSVEASHRPWKELQGISSLSDREKLIAQVIHLADTVSLLLNGSKSVLNQVAYIREVIAHQAGSEFCPEIVRAFEDVSRREGVWMDMLYRPQMFLDFIPDNRYVSLSEAVELTENMSRIIDFRSPFTAMHSAGVAATAQCLARLVGMSDDECRMMRIAGYLHDIGKLKIPKSILEKPGKLTDEEFNVMKEHAYYTYILLKDVAGFERITEWAAFHHEKLNGNGYPLHLDADCIPLGSRIMAVADVFSAITEERPYRSGMDREQAISVLRDDAARGALSQALVDLLIANYDDINARRAEESSAASERYRESLEQAG